MGFLAWPALAAGPAPKLPATFDVPAIDGYLAAQVQQGQRVGLSVVIVKDGQVVLEKGYGVCALPKGPLVKTDSLFAIGSVSKQFTCACILLLAEDGKLSVRDKVAKYYSGLTRANDITLLDLMNHVSGYPDYYPLDFVDRRMQRPIAEDELLRQYGGAALDFEPGTKYSYSNTGYILLGRVVEKVSGESFGAFLTRRILQPLGLAHTVYEPDLADARLAKGHASFALSSPEPIAPEGRGWLCGAGGIYSTPGDLAKWDLALLDGQLLKPDSFALMTAPRTLAGGRISDYGCGLAVRTQNGRQILSHNGAVSGFSAYNAMIPSTRSAVIMLGNAEGGLGALPGQVLSLLLKDAPSVPIVKASPAADTAKALFAQLQSGKVDRRQFTEEFNQYLTDDKLAGAARRLKPYGAPRSAEVLGAHERGGMEVTTTRLVFKSGELRALMYRRPNGQVEQFFVSKE